LGQPIFLIALIAMLAISVVRRVGGVDDKVRKTARRMD
jgi:hypothetical protein